MKYLLDTNVLSEPTKPTPDAGVVEALAQHQGEVATAAVVMHVGHEVSPGTSIVGQMLRRWRPGLASAPPLG